jgi:hypothetical protein
MIFISKDHFLIALWISCSGWDYQEWNIYMKTYLIDGRSKEYVFEKGMLIT